nr:MAG TPA: hypothetical protein [Bacteriophage sp.]
MLRVYIYINNLSAGHTIAKCERICRCRLACTA